MAAPDLRTAAACVLALAAAACADERPDVVLVSLDSVRADALSFRDRASAPRLFELAREGTVFTQAVSGSSWTLPAHAQMFTAQPPVLHGVQYDDVAIDPRTPTLPELLSDADYLTAGFWTGWYLAGEYGFERGFDVYGNAMTGGEEIEREYRRAVEAGEHEKAQQVLAARDVRGHQDVTSPTVVKEVGELLRTGRAERRDLFLFLHLFDPHYDYVPPPPWDERFDPHYEGDVDGRGFYLNREIYDPDARPRRRISDRDLQHVFALYRGEIGWTDAAVGEVLDLLERRGRLEEAIVIVTSDHGDEFFEHGGRGHRHTLFDELLRVPLLVRLPERMRGPATPSEIGAQVSLSDLAPTILDAAGLPIPPTMAGRSLLPALRGEPIESRPAVATLHPTSAGSAPRRVHEALRTPEGKLLRRLVLRDGRLHVKEIAWFDLEEDPGERRPVTDPEDPRVVAGARALDRELERLRERWERMPRTPPAERSTRVRELFQSDLAALGYADGGDAGEEVERSPGLSWPWGLAPHPAPEPPDRDPGGAER